MAIDGGKWYEKKLQEAKVKSAQSKPSDTQQVPYLPYSGWRNFPSINIPIHFNMGHIHHHIVESVQFVGSVSQVDSGDDEDIEDLHTSKPMKKGRIYFKSGHVQNMKDCRKNEHYFIKAKVMASYKVDVFYDTTVTLSSQSGFVKDASCNCVASGMGRCNHVAALLFAMLDYMERYGHEPAASTSMKCTWNVGRKRKKNPQKAQDSVKLSGKKKKVHDIIKFDPRPPSLCEPGENGSKRDLLWSLGCYRLNDSMWNTVLFHTYSDFELDSVQTEVLKEQRKLLLENLSVVSGHDAVLVTSGQNNEDWFLERRLRITASHCKPISTMNQKTSVTTIANQLNNIMWETKRLRTSAVVYGQANESRARSAYTEKMRAGNPDIKVEETGFWVHPKFPELGCSPDGLVTDNCEGEHRHGLLEIKCPKILEGKDVTKFETVLTKSQVARFCLHWKNNKIILRRSHQYYHQIQMQMGILGRKWCDFVVWSSVNLVVERIKFDESFWNSLRRKLVVFHHMYVCPEHFQMKIPRELSPIQLSVDTDS